MSIQFDLMENPLFREQYENAMELTRLETLKNVAKNMYQDGQDIRKIAQMTGLSESEVKQLLH
jgi:predicted transposase/invertase (TIGR01784 family)